MLNYENYPFTKKESVFESLDCLKAQSNSFLQEVDRSTINKSSLVYIINISRDIERKIKNWSRLSDIERLFFVFGLGKDLGFKAFTVDFSYKFAIKAKNSSNAADFIRRRINSNFNNTLGYIPKYCFILDESDKENLHLHGIIQIDDIAKIKSILKRTVFGRDYKKHPMNRKMVYFRDLDENWTKWLAYCLHNKENLEIYLSRQLSQSTRSKYEGMFSNGK